MKHVVAIGSATILIAVSDPKSLLTTCSTDRAMIIMNIIVQNLYD